MNFCCEKSKGYILTKVWLPKDSRNNSAVYACQGATKDFEKYAVSEASIPRAQILFWHKDKPFDKILRFIIESILNCMVS